MKLADLQAKRKEYKDMIEKQGESLLKEAFTEFFNNNPYIDSIKFIAYIPYFNDGDICEFSVHNFHVKLLDIQNGGDNEDGYFSPWELSCSPKEKYCNEELKQVELELRTHIAKNVNEFYTLVVDNELFQIVFGDHVSVIANREGFDVEVYEHE